MVIELNSATECTCERCAQAFAALLAGQDPDALVTVTLEATGETKTVRLGDLIDDDGMGSSV